LHLHKKIFVIKQVYFYCAGKQAAKRQEEKLCKVCLKAVSRGKKRHLLPLLSKLRPTCEFVFKLADLPRDWEQLADGD